MSRHHKLVLLWSAASLALVAVLFPAFGTTPAVVVARLASAPWTMYALVVLLTVGNQLAGAQKWRFAARQLSGGAHTYSMRASFETTVLGALLGQVLPIQVTTAVVRGIVGSARSGGAPIAVGATAFEQLFDLVVLCAAGLAGLAAIGIGLGIPMSVSLVLSAAFAGVLLSRGFCESARAIIAMSRRNASVRLARPLRRAEVILTSASSVSWRATIVLGLLSVARMLFMAGRVVAVAAVIAPRADRWEVALGYPAIGIVGALPITPGGLGVVEWSWSGLLLHAGALPSEAAVAAISLRIVNLAALTAILAFAGALRVVVPERVSDTG